MPASPNDLVAEWLKLDDFCDAQMKALAEHLKPHRDRMEAIKNDLLELSNTQKVRSIKTDSGTMIKQQVMAPKMTDKMALLDFCLEDWDARGDLINISAPPVASVRAWMDANNGQPPPNVQVEFIERISIRRS